MASVQKFGPEQYVITATCQITMNIGVDNHGPKMITDNDVGVPLTFNHQVKMYTWVQLQSKVQFSVDIQGTQKIYAYMLKLATQNKLI